MKKIISIITLCLFTFSVYTQTRNCGTMEHLEFLKSEDPLLEAKMQKNEAMLQNWIKNNPDANAKSAVLTIPVVVHVVYNNSTENISTAQVQSQIDILNEDFRRLNADASNTPSGFQSVAADAEIEFCLASTDPNGNSTTGITRTSTSQSSFSYNNDGVKYSSSGGIDAWNTSEYLNIWVCDLSSGLLGYAQFPGGNASSDGVVCDYAYFGNIGTATSPFHLGRTATHEVGHYLNLRHIWGDSNCGNDYCNDTPEHSGSNYGCPNYPSTSNCSGNGSYGDMFMNYMDYTDDACMNMFSQDQKTRMIAAINTYRSGLLNSNACQPSGYGCTDPNASNYDPSAVTDDGSCCYSAGCTDATSCNYDAAACYDDGSCLLPDGCTDPSATNYDPNATCDDGSCCFGGGQLLINITTDNYPSETSWQLVNQSGVVVESINSGDLISSATNYSWSVCVNSNECYDFIIYDTYGDGICCSYGSGSYTLTYGGTVVASGGAFASSETTSNIICGSINYGCTDPVATNYDPNATVDDGSCAYCATTLPYSEDFNNGIGSWTNTGSAGDWILNSGGTPSNNTGPTDDVTGGGNYMYIESSATNNPNVGPFTLTSECFDISNVTNPSLSFYYNMYGSAIGILNVYANNSLIWTLNGDQGQGWNLAQIPLTSTGNTLIIEFKGTTGSSWAGDIAIDNIEIIVTQQISGCTDPLADNYDANATVDDGSCIYCVDGCMDPTQFNYDANATCDDGSCIPYTYGCTDATASNYNSTVNTDDGSCIWLGCTDAAADNYDATATVDDGSCTYTTVCTSPKPTGLYAFDIIDTKAKIGWDNMNSSTCMVLKYFVRYREVGATTWITKSAGVGNGLCQFGLNTTEKWLPNLSPSTTYEFKMKAFYCGGTSSNYSASTQFTTADVCPDMINLAVQTFNSNTGKAKFTWDTTGVYVFARVSLRVDTSGAAWQTVGGFGINWPTFSQNKFGLTPGESYRAQGRTFCHTSITAYRSATWTSPIFWTQPSAIRMDVGTAITNLDVYPNPSRDIFNISFTSEDAQDLRVRVLNVIGEVIVSDELEQFVGEYTKQINLHENAKGIYFLEIETNDGVINKKLILQ